MTVQSRKLTAAALALALCASSTASVAASTPGSSSAAPMNPWVALSAFDSNAAAALSGSAMSAPSEVGETASSNNSSFGRPPVLALSVILGTLATAAWIILKNPSHHKPRPVSPS